MLFDLSPRIRERPLIMHIGGSAEYLDCLYVYTSAVCICIRMAEKEPDGLSRVPVKELHTYIHTYA